MYIRLEFSRGDKMKCLSHLDMMRTFGRAIRRSGIPISYTSGFNPHAQMVFGLPLQVGVTGDAEYLDIKVDEELREPGELGTSDAFDVLVHKLNANLPEGIAVNAARERTAKENIMSIITHATYEMRVGLGADIGWDDAGSRRDVCAALEWAVACFLLPGPRIVAKDSGARTNRGSGNLQKSKKRHSKEAIRTIDLAPLVYALEARGDILAMTVTAGSVNNVKPDLVLEALNTTQKKLYKISLHRKELLVEREGILYKPIDIIICDTKKEAGNAYE